MMKKPKNIHLIICALITIFFTSGANAQDTQYESMGLFDAGHKYSLGTGLYHQSSRAALTKLLEQTPTSQWITLERTINHFLLTTADASAIKNDITVPAGKDLFTLRLNALLKRGLNKQAFDLFTKIPNEITQESLAYTGVMSMLLNKEKALACLETKTLLPRFKDKPFWQELDAYCTLSLSTQPHKAEQETIANSNKRIIESILSSTDFKFEYTPNTFATLSPLERALLTADNRITLQNAYKDTPAQHIAPLLQQSYLSEKTRTLLTMQAIKHGIIEINSLTHLYETLNTKDSPVEGIGEIAALYGETKKGWFPKKRKKKIERAFALAEKYGELSLLPFIPTLMEMKPGVDLSLENAKRSAFLFLYTDQPFPSKWIKYLQKISLDPSKNKHHETLRSQILFVAITRSKAKDENLMHAARESIKPYQFSNNTRTALKNITETIDINTIISDKVQYIYENDFDLTENRSYTMPPSVLMDALRQSSKNQDIGSTLLLSSAILGRIKYEDLYPETLGDIIVALRNTGLKQLSRDIMAQAILEIENKGED